LISKWEYHARERGANLINYDPKPIAEEKEPSININSRGRIRTDVDVDNPHQSIILKVVPEATKYDPIKQK
jgi:hypothetical protein